MELEAQLMGEQVEFIGCPVCSQAVPKSWHIDQHLEMLKPLCGMKAECMVCGDFFIEHRALQQHLNFCRLKANAAASTVGGSNSTATTTETA
jgi:hypothetical protein